CVRGRDAAEVERIIDDRHEKIGGRHQGLVLAELIDGGIVGALQTDQQLRERRRGSCALEQIGEHARGDLAAEATAAGQGGQPRRGSGGGGRRGRGGGARCTRL